MKYYFAKHPDSITHSNWAIKETGAISYAFDITEEQLAAVESGASEWVITGENLSIKNSNRLAEQEAAKAQAEAAAEVAHAETSELKEKLAKGEGSLEDIQYALSKLL